MDSFLSDGAEYLAPGLNKAKNMKMSDALSWLGGKPGLNARIKETGQSLNFLTGGKMAKTVGRFAGSKPVRGILRMVPGLSVGFAALDAADIVTNDTNLANKGMDTAGMAIGAAIGSVGGPVGAFAGASTGKFVSDGIQYLFGDKKSPEQRKMEEALAALKGY